MAFMSKVGNLLRQSVSKNINSELSGSNPSIFQVIRSMSSSKVFVGGLSWNTDDSSLRQAFAEHGEVVEARVIIDRDNGRSRGFGFVTYASTEEASKAISQLDGQNIDGRAVRVNYATERSGGGFRSGGGGYSGGGAGYNSGGGYNGGGGGNTYSGAGGSGGYDGSYGSGNSAGGNFSVAGGVGGSESNFTGGAGGGESGDSSFASRDYTGNTGGSFEQTGPLEGSFQDDDGQPADYANRQG